MRGMMLKIGAKTRRTIGRARRIMERGGRRKGGEEEGENDGDGDEDNDERQPLHTVGRNAFLNISRTWPGQKAKPDVT